LKEENAVEIIDFKKCDGVGIEPRTAEAQSERVVVCYTGRLTFQHTVQLF
jgi:hypothetical protein